MTTAAPTTYYATFLTRRGLWTLARDGFATADAAESWIDRTVATVLSGSRLDKEHWRVIGPDGLVARELRYPAQRATGRAPEADDGIEMALRTADLGFSVGSPDEARIASVAQEWRDEGFTAAQVSTWLAAGCFRAVAAAELRAGGVSMGEAGQTWRDGMTIGYAVANSDLTVVRAVAFLRTADLCAEVAALVGDTGEGDLGVIVRQALADDSAVTPAEVAEIVRQARADAAREAE